MEKCVTNCCRYCHSLKCEQTGARQQTWGQIKELVAKTRLVVLKNDSRAFTNIGRLSMAAGRVVRREICQLCRID